MYGLTGQNRARKRGWTSPIATDLALVEGPAPLLSIVERIAERAIEEAGFGSCSFPNSALVPITRVAKALGVGVEVGDSSARRGWVEPVPNGFRAVVVRSHDSHYRFVVAHELAHVLLRRAVGPMASSRLSPVDARRAHAEEELLAHILALCLLAPRSLVEQMLSALEGRTASTVSSMRSAFGLSDFLAFRRLALHWRAYLVFWRVMRNPRTQSSREELRAAHVFPNIYGVVTAYIPAYATAKSGRFAPDVIEAVRHSTRPISQDVRIRGFGELRDEVRKVTAFPLVALQDLPFEAGQDLPSLPFQVALIICDDNDLLVQPKEAEQA